MTETVESNVPVRRVFVLGAGFSKAISDTMLLAEELGAQVAQKLQLPEEITRGDFEGWLSRLAEPQPDLSDVENYHRQEHFVRAVETIGGELEEIQRNVKFPKWLDRFVTITHLWQADLISFNYDNLIEIATAAAQLRPKEELFLSKKISAGDVVAQRPQLPLGASRAPFMTMRLWKLHGSLSWWWVRGDRTGLAIARWPIDQEELETSTLYESTNPLGTGPSSWPAEPYEADSARRERLLPGRVRFIAPPLGMKSEYFQNPLMIQLWRGARHALSNATDVYFVGYSLPYADMAARGLFREAIPQSTRIWIVDKCPRSIEAISAQITNWGFDDVNEISGEESVAQMVDDLEKMRASEVVRALRDLSDLVRFVDTEGHEQAGRVLDVSSDKRGLVAFDRIEKCSLYLRPILNGADSNPCSIRDLFEYLADTNIDELLVDSGDGLRKVIDHRSQKETIIDGDKAFTLRELWLY